MNYIYCILAEYTLWIVLLWSSWIGPPSVSWQFYTVLMLLEVQVWWTSDWTAHCPMIGCRLPDGRSWQQHDGSECSTWRWRRSRQLSLLITSSIILPSGGRYPQTGWGRGWRAPGSALCWWGRTWLSRGLRMQGAAAVCPPGREIPSANNLHSAKAGDACTSGTLRDTQRDPPVKVTQLLSDSERSCM